MAVGGGHDERGRIINHGTSNKWFLGIVDELRTLPLTCHFDKAGTRVPVPRAKTAFNGVALVAPEMGETMINKPKKRFFTSHSKSSAMVASLALHAILLVVALSFVAVTVVTKSDKKFESRQVNRPRMPPKKLQVPVKIKKQKRKPKLRQRIVVKTKVRNMPDIKMPEITGIKGGLGAGVGAGLGDAGGVGFSMPEIEVFGVRSKGEKVFIALDSDGRMMRDEVGGMRAYTIIKEELARIIEGLSPTTLFNLVVFEHHSAVALFPRMVPATRENVAKVEKWLESLNKVSAGMGATSYGTKTIGKGGTPLPMTGELARGDIKKEALLHWSRPAAEAMAQQADAVFILTGWWGVLREVRGKFPEWSESSRKRWEEKIREGEELHKKENAKRAANGDPPQVIRDNNHLIIEYFGEANWHAWRRPDPPWYHYTGRDYAEALNILRKECASNLPSKSGITKKRPDKFSLNVVYYAAKDTGINSGEEENFKRLTSLCRGKLRVISGLEAIQKSVSAER